jgi:hypothetical protein
MNERLKGVHDLAVEISEDGKLNLKEAFKLLDLAFCAGELSMIQQTRKHVDNA